MSEGEEEISRREHSHRWRGSGERNKRETVKPELHSFLFTPLSLFRFNVCLQRCYH